MQAENSHDSSTIPDTGETVKKLLTSALVGAPVRVHNLGLSVSKEASVNEALQALDTLVSADTHMTIRSRFCQGDLFRQMNLRGKDKRAFIAGVKAAHGERFYNTLRRYGWVASKWREDRRSDNRCWAFYVNNEPGRPALPKRDKVRGELALVSREGDLLTLETPAGAQWTYLLSDNDDRNPSQEP